MLLWFVALNDLKRFESLNVICIIQLLTEMRHFFAHEMLLLN